MIIASIAAFAYLAVVLVADINQRALIFFPSHQRSETQLRPWVVEGRTIGFCREVNGPGTVWLMAHGNAGQASQRDYVLGHVAPGNSLYVLEYPGYGQREGSPSKASMDGAAAEAYHVLRKEFPRTPVGVVGESIGSGPVSSLASDPVPPDKIVLIVPFDTFASVAQQHMPFLPVRAILKDKWDNIQALSGYAGPIDIYGATDDRIIPVEHARRLAAALHNARFVLIPGGHNDWSNSDQVRIAR